MNVQRRRKYFHFLCSVKTSQFFATERIFYLAIPQNDIFSWISISEDCFRWNRLWLNVQNESDEVFLFVWRPIQANILLVLLTHFPYIFSLIDVNWSITWTELNVGCPNIQLIRNSVPVWLTDSDFISSSFVYLMFFFWETISKIFTVEFRVTRKYSNLASVVTIKQWFQMMTQLYIQLKINSVVQSKKISSCCVRFRLISPAAVLSQ